MTHAPLRRSSPAMVGVVAIRLLASAVAATIVALVLQALVGTATSTTVFLLIAAAALVRLTLVVVDWRTMTYRDGGDAFEVRRGRISTSTQHIAWSAFTAVEVEAPWLLRLLGCVVLDLHHAGDGGSIRLPAVRRAEADRLVARIAAANPRVDVDDADDERDDPRHRIAPQGSALLRAIAGAHPWLAIPLAVSALGIVAQVRGASLLATVEWAAASFASWPLGMQVAVAGVVVIAALVASVVLQLVRSAGFDARFDGSQLTSRRGLFTSATRSIAWSDVTVVELRRPLLFRLLRRVTILASGGAGRGEPPLTLALDASIDDGEALVERILGRGPRGRAVARSSKASFLLLGVGRGRVDISSEGRVDWTRGLVVHRRRAFDVGSVLHVETMRRDWADRLPVHGVTAVVADRGARRLTIRWLTADAALALSQGITHHPRFATYRYATHHRRHGS